MNHRPMNPDELAARHAELQRLKVDIEVEIVAIENALRMHGQWRRSGRPRKPPTHTDAEAAEAHALYSIGKRTPWVIAGNRQYQRDQARRHYERKVTEPWVSDE